LEKNKAGFVKSQHNLDIEYDVEATIQPVASLTKPEVRAVLDYLKMPQELVYRKAFPGPALSARIIGPVTMENLAFQKKVHDIVESHVEDYYTKTHGKPMIINDMGEQEPFQVFAATSENVASKKVTGLKDGRRTYDLPFIETGEWDFEALLKKASEISGYARLFYELAKNSEGKYDVIIRSVNSIDARTATVTNLPFDLITELKEKILQITEVKNVYIDITPKPPATIEYV
jgi:GMP synthase (glutamine-hydrolysing)